MGASSTRLMTRVWWPSPTLYNLHTKHPDALHSILLLIRLHHRDLTCLIRSAIRQDVKNLQYCFGAVVFTLKAILESVRLLMTFNVCLTTPIMTDVIRMALVSMLRHAPHQMSHALQWLPWVKGLLNSSTFSGSNDMKLEDVPFSLLSLMFVSYALLDHDIQSSVPWLETGWMCN